MCQFFVVGTSCKGGGGLGSQNGVFSLVAHAMFVY